MVDIRKLHKDDIAILYDIVLRSFPRDSEKQDVYPRAMGMIKNGVFPPNFPPLMFGKAILVDGAVIGGAFVACIGKKGEIGAIFLDPPQQRKGYGKQAVLMIEEMHPKVRRWKLEAPAERLELHTFFEALGYVKSGELNDKKSGRKGFVFEKVL